MMQWRGSRSGLLATTHIVSGISNQAMQQLIYADTYGGIEICGNEQFILGRDPELWYKFRSPK
jgi:hypothetical protein